MTYLWIKALHISAIFVWMAAMLAAPAVIAWLGRQSIEVRTAAAPASRTLFRRLSVPAMILTWALGLWLMSSGSGMASGWMHAKLLFVVIVSGVHGMYSGMLRRIASNNDFTPPAWISYLLPAKIAMLVVIAVLVIVKPF